MPFTPAPRGVPQDASRAAHAASRAARLPHRPEHGPLVVLCGPMGSGKTTVGLALGRRWAVELRDTDEDVVARAGAAIPDIFREQGEEGFRRLEHEAVAAALAEHQGVLALGGGAVLHAGTQADLARYVAAGGVVVFLDVSAEHAAPRVGLNDSRPLLTGDPQRRWAEIMRERRDVYEAVSTLRILTDGMTAGEVAREIERRLRAVTREHGAGSRRHPD